MVFIRLDQALRGKTKFTKEDVLQIGEHKYVSFSTLKQKHPNLNLKQYIKSENIVSQLTIKSLQQPPPPAQHVQLMKQLHYKHERRMYQKILDPRKANKTYFQTTPDQGIREMQKSISFALTFIFSFFLAGATGYLLGIYIFNVGHVNSMIICIFFVVGTLFVEASLFVIRSNRMDATKAKKQKLKEQEKMRKIGRFNDTGISPEMRKQAEKVYTQQKKKQ